MLDAVNMATGGTTVAVVDAVTGATDYYDYHMSATNYASDITAVVSFTAYAGIMLGGV